MSLFSFGNQSIACGVRKSVRKIRRLGRARIGLKRNREYAKVYNA